MISRAILHSHTFMSCFFLDDILNTTSHKITFCRNGFDYPPYSESLKWTIVLILPYCTVTFTTMCVVLTKANRPSNFCNQILFWKFLNCTGFPSLCIHLTLSFTSLYSLLIKRLAKFLLWPDELSTNQYLFCHVMTNVASVV